MYRRIALTIFLGLVVALPSSGVGEKKLDRKSVV